MKKITLLALSLSCFLAACDAPKTNQVVSINLNGAAVGTNISSTPLNQPTPNQIPSGNNTTPQGGVSTVSPTSPGPSSGSGANLPTPVKTPEPIPNLTQPSSPAGWATISSSNILVEGLGKDLYYIFNLNGERLDSKLTNSAKELLPGTYQISVGGSSSEYKRETITISPNQQTKLTAGSLIVRGTGKDLYYIYNDKGERLDSKLTNSLKELFPGTYQISMGGSSSEYSRLPLTVTAKSQSELVAGSLVVRGTGKDLYYIYNDKGERLDSKLTNSPKELFPGTYQISVGGSSSAYPRVTVTVTANNQTEVN